MTTEPGILAQKLGEMDIFHTIPADILLHLAAQCRIETFGANDNVFEKDEPGRSFYMILDGAARVHDGDFTVAHMTAGHCFGEMALLDEGPRSMSVSATIPTRLARIDREVFFDVLGDHPDVMQKIVGLLTRRLRFQTDKTLEQLRKREEELFQLVEERTAELMAQKEEAEKLRRKAEAEKKEAEKQRLRAEQSERAEQQFLANMSHEIRTPMNAVLGMTSILMQKSPREDQMRYLKSILQSSEALLVILNDILDISKIQAGKLELEFTGFRLTDILEQVRATLQFRAEEKALALELDFDKNIPPVLIGDPVRLQQVLLNLAGNAVKFTETGAVKLVARALKKDNDACRLYFEVRDTGIGMTPEQLNVVFESFRQASGDTTRKYGGTGLGLSISKQLVERFGGNLQARSMLGKGSTFFFEIELKIGNEMEVEAATSQRDAAYALRGLRIMVAEDNHFNRIVAEETLELLVPDVEVVCVENGQEAVNRAKEEQFDVILMDVTMPVMDGIQATREIRAMTGPAGAVPIIAFTASVTQKEVKRCLGNGMNGCVPKPFKDAELINALMAVIKPELQPLSSAPEPEPAAPGPADNRLTFLEELTGGNPTRIRKYLNLYLESVREGVPRIEAALAKEDRLELRKVVHTIKPQFRMLGMEALAELAQTIENQAVEGIALEQLPENVNRLLEEVRASVQSFEEYLQQS